MSPPSSAVSSDSQLSLAAARATDVSPAWATTTAEVWVWVYRMAGLGSSLGTAIDCFGVVMGDGWRRGGVGVCAPDAYSAGDARLQVGTDAAEEPDPELPVPSERESEERGVPVLDGDAAPPAPSSSRPTSLSTGWKTGEKMEPESRHDSSSSSLPPALAVQHAPRTHAQLDAPRTHTRRVAYLSRRDGATSGCACFMGDSGPAGMRFFVLAAPVGAVGRSRWERELVNIAGAGQSRATYRSLQAAASGAWKRSVKPGLHNVHT